MLKRLATAFVLLLVTSAAFAQHEHHLMTADDFRALAASLSKHGPVIAQPEATVVPAATIAPAATVPFTITAIATSKSSAHFTVSPSNFTVNQGDTVDITLTVPANDFALTHGLLMDTYIDPGQNVNRGQSISISFVATTPGTFGFVCNVPSCSDAHSNMFGTMTVNAVAQPAPTITSLNPTTGPTAGGTTVTITGTGFANGATVSFGGTNGTNVTVVSGTSITVRTPAHAAGQVGVSVTNPDAQSATLPNGFTYAPPGAVVSSINPSTGPTSGNTPVTITGTNFQQGATVTIGGQAASHVTVVNSTTITALTPLGPANEQVAQVAAVKVTNPDSSFGTANLFTYTVPALAIAGISPPVGSPAGGNVIEILGAGFTTTVTSSVKVGGITATNVQVLDAVTIKATVPAHAAGQVDVAVTMGSTTVTKPAAYVYANPPSKKRAVAH